jgi:hypothetical protein
LIAVQLVVDLDFLLKMVAVEVVVELLEVLL